MGPDLRVLEGAAPSAPTQALRTRVLPVGDGGGDHAPPSLPRLPRARILSGMSLVLRTLGPDDIPFGMGLKEMAGWNQTVEDWRCLLSFRPEGCFLALHDGVPAGTVTTIDHGGAFGWIGMLLVRGDLRRLGIGAELLRTALASLDALPAVKLDATPLGETLYQQYSFEVEALIERRVRPAGPPPPEEGSRGGLSLRPFATDDLEPAADLDAEGFGARRADVLDAWRRSLPGSSLVGEMGGRLRGFVLARRGTRGTHLGPIVAEGIDGAKALLHGAVSRCGVATDVIVDTFTSDPAWLRHLDRLEFEVRRRLTRMRRGPFSSAPDPRILLASAGPEAG